jgi:hypothetical protein
MLIGSLLLIGGGVMVVRGELTAAILAYATGLFALMMMLYFGIIENGGRR